MRNNQSQSGDGQPAEQSVQFIAPPAKVAESVAPLEVVVRAATVEAEVNGLSDSDLLFYGLHLAQRSQREACQCAETAARVLVKAGFSHEEHIEAQAELDSFLTDQLKFDDGDARRRFTPWWLSRIDRFPTWPTLVAELLTGRWRRAEWPWPFSYIRLALHLDAVRYYAVAKRELQARDKDAVLDGTDSQGEDGRSRNPSGRPGAQRGKPGVPAEIARVIVNRDFDLIMTKAGTPERVRTLLRQRMATLDSDAEIMRRLGWTVEQGEAAQTAWRRTWQSRVQAAAVAGRYLPREPKKSSHRTSANSDSKFPIESRRPDAGT